MLGIVLSAPNPSVSVAAWALFLTALAARLVLHFVPWLRGTRPLMADLWLVPVHDLLMVWVWLRAFFVSRISWRGIEYAVGAGGIMRRIS
jgi:hypothetical protein